MDGNFVLFNLTELQSELPVADDNQENVAIEEEKTPESKFDNKHLVGSTSFSTPLSTPISTQLTPRVSEEYNLSPNTFSGIFSTNPMMSQVRVS